jgi:hypothetical protein
MWWRDAFACGEYYGETTIGCMCACGSKMQVYLRILTKKKSACTSTCRQGLQRKEIKLRCGAYLLRMHMAAGFSLLSCACNADSDFLSSNQHPTAAFI